MSDNILHVYDDVVSLDHALRLRALGFNGATSFCYIYNKETKEVIAKIPSYSTFPKALPNDETIIDIVPIPSVRQVLHFVHGSSNKDTTEALLERYITKTENELS